MFSSTKTRRVFLADDHVVLRQGLKAILEQQDFEVVGEASDGHTSIKMCSTMQPEIAVLDVGMPVLNGIDAAREIRKVCPNTKIILLTMYADESCVLAGLRAGITGYVLKNNAFCNLTHAIEAVCRGETYLSPAITRMVVKASFSNAAPPSADPLSDRERQVLQLIAEGKNMKEVGATLAACCMRNLPVRLTRRASLTPRLWCRTFSWRTSSCRPDSTLKEAFDFFV
jgi:DNA-binding NarL/FixJ family response regulator